jgi:hypothetical protein
MPYDIMIVTELGKNTPSPGSFLNSLTKAAMVTDFPPLVMKRSITSMLLSLYVVLISTRNASHAFDTFKTAYQCGVYAMISAAVMLPDGKERFQLGLLAPKALLAAMGDAIALSDLCLSTAKGSRGARYLLGFVTAQASWCASNVSGVYAEGKAILSQNM